MSNLKSIVPPLDLCKKIPEWEFVDSALVWEKTEKYFQATEIIDYEYKAVPRSESCGGFPAPTLEEVLEAIGKVENWDTATITRPVGVNTRIVDTALKRWFEVKGINFE